MLFMYIYIYICSGGGVVPKRIVLFELDFCLSFFLHKKNLKP